MSYAVTDDLIARLGENKYASIYRTDHGKAESDLAESSAEIDGYLSKRYVVPVTAAQAMILLRAWTLDLAEEKSYKRAGGSEIPEKVKNAANVVRSNLHDIAKGTMLLPAAAAENPGSAGGSVLVVGNEPEFTREKMSGY